MKAKCEDCGKKEWHWLLQRFYGKDLCVECRTKFAALPSGKVTSLFKARLSAELFPLALHAAAVRDGSGAIYYVCPHCGAVEDFPPGMKPVCYNPLCVCAVMVVEYAPWIRHPIAVETLASAMRTIREYVANDPFFQIVKMPDGPLQWDEENQMHYKVTENGNLVVEMNGEEMDEVG